MKLTNIWGYVAMGADKGNWTLRLWDISPTRHFAYDMDISPTRHFAANHTTSERFWLVCVFVVGVRDWGEDWNEGADWETIWLCSGV